MAEGAVLHLLFFMEYDKTFLKEYLENIVIIVDTREKVNQHILDFFNINNIKFLIQTMPIGDYGIAIDKEQVEECFPVVIERKNGIDELVGNFKMRDRFNREFMRAKKNKVKIHLMVEDKMGYQNILRGNYRSEFNSTALMHSLKAFETRYSFDTVFLDKCYAGHYIYTTLLFYIREVFLQRKDTCKED